MQRILENLQLRATHSVDGTRTKNAQASLILLQRKSAKTQQFMQSGPQTNTM